MKIEKMNKSNFNKWTKNNIVEWHKTSGTSDGFYSQEFFTCETLKSDLIIITHYNKPIAYVVKSIEALKNSHELQKNIFTVYGLNYIFNGKNEQVAVIKRQEERHVTNEEYELFQQINEKNESLEKEHQKINDFLMNEGKQLLGIEQAARKDVLKMIKIFESDERYRDMFNRGKMLREKIIENKKEFLQTYNYDPCNYVLIASDRKLYLRLEKAYGRKYAWTYRVAIGNRTVVSGAVYYSSYPKKYKAIEQIKKELAKRLEIDNAELEKLINNMEES